MAVTAALEIILQARDEATGVLNGLGSALGGLGGIAGTVATGGLAAAGAAVAGIAAGTGLAAKAVWDFSRDTDDAMKLFSAQTGVAGESLTEMREIAKDVWAEGFGEGIGQVTEQMATVHQALDLTGEDLAAATKQAMTLSEVFEYDVAESTAIASSVMTNFGVDSETAFDIIAKGSQMGLNRMGDLGDTLHEYSSDFRRLGFTAEDTLNMLNAGLEAGAYNTDVVADGFREMGIRLMEGGDDVSAAFDAIGMDFERIQGFVASGDETWGDYASTIVQGLMEIDNEVERNAAGVAIFGTKWEDVGGQVFLAAGQAQGAIDGLSGTTEQAAEAMSSGIGPALERLKRSVVENLSPLGEYAGQAIDQAAPYIDQFAGWLSEKIPVAIDTLKAKWAEIWPPVQSYLIQAQEWTAEMWEAIQPAYNWMRDTFKDFTATLLPHLQAAWDDLRRGLNILNTLFEQRLLPALESLWDSLGLGQVETDEWGAVVGDLAGLIVRVGIENLIISLANAIESAAQAAEWASGAVDSVRNAINEIGGVVDWVIGKINSLKDALNSITVPPILQPGSPTPFEMGLRGIADALDSMPPLQAKLGFAGGGAAGAMGGGVVTIHNHFGPGSVRSDYDIEEIGRRQEEMLRLRGYRTWVV